MTQNNPLLQKFTTPYATPPFASIRTEDYMPALIELIAQARESVIKIAENNEPSDFLNTVEALEYTSLHLDSVAAILFNLNHANTSPELQAAVIEAAPMMAALSNDISLNKALFRRIKTVYENRLTSNLTDEQIRLTEKTYEEFVRGGANLTDEDSVKYRAVTEELSVLTESFTQCVLSATNDYILHITDKDKLVGLPSSAIDSALCEAKEREMEGWVITLQAQSFVPFMQYSEDRELRYQLWKAYSSRGFVEGANDNRENIRRITELRLELAILLGYERYSDYVLEQRMAKTTDNVISFLDELLEYSKPVAQQEVNEIRTFAESLGFTQEFQPWDFSFYSEKYKEKYFNLSDEMLKPYFKLENVRDGLFTLLNELYGITLKPSNELELYHKDVETYEVYDKGGERLLALLYMDFFPRSSKSGGAWMTSFRDRTIDSEGNEIVPIISVVCNFTKPTDTKPSLLSFNETTTLFHEFGHALHGIFAEGYYPSISGTNVSWDFVELPSQILENWAIEPTFLSRFAPHYKSGEPLPQELIDKIIAARNFLSGTQFLRQLSFCYTDMAWHTITKPIDVSIKEFEQKQRMTLDLFPPQADTCFSTAFTHVFSGGYAAGYYSYKWAESLEADAFGLFQEKGVLDRATAQKFRDTVLSQGDRKDAMDLYVAFRGREPKLEALLEKSGLKIKS